MTMADGIPEPVFLVFGRTGWIGGLLGEQLRSMGAKFEYASARLEDRVSIIAEIDRVRAGAPSPAAAACGAVQQHPAAACVAQVHPTHVLNAAGCTGRPNVDWCETHKASNRVTRAPAVAAMHG
jgi:hypothetical protein